MKRRTLLQCLGSAAALWPLMRIQSADLSTVALAKADELPADQVFVLRDVAATVLPAAIGAKGQNDAVDHFLR